MTFTMNRAGLGLITLAGALLANGALALGQPAGSDWTRGDSGSLYAEWDVFGAITGNSPDVGSAHLDSAIISETTGASFVTSGGNIYGFGAPAAFTLNLDSGVTGPATGSQVDVHLQLVTQGTGLDLGSVLLNGHSGAGGLVSSEPLGGFGGALDTYLFSWTLAAVDNWSFHFNAQETHLSLDKVAVDVGEVAAVPLPAAAWLFGSCLSGLIAVRRSRRTA